jgi:NitT/TauT family transport system substrate-binding protein
MIKSKSWPKLVCVFITGILLITPGPAEASVKRHPLRLVYNGHIYETPLWVSFQKGFFKEEGLKVELVETAFEDLQQQMNSGQVDGITADYRIFRPLARGLKLKLIAGLHGGCIRIIAATGSKIKSIGDLKHKTIGVEAIGDGPMVVSSLLLRSNGIDTVKQVTWKAVSKTELTKKLAEGRIDAAAVWETAGLARASSDTVVIFSTARNKSFLQSHNSYRHFYGSFLGLREGLIQNDPQTAAAVSRAWLKAARWVGDHPQEAAKIMASRPEDDNSQVATEILNVMWMPGVLLARENIRFYISEQKELRILNPKLNVVRFFKRIYAPIIPELNG